MQCKYHGASDKSDIATIILSGNTYCSYIGFQSTNMAIQDHRAGVEGTTWPACVSGG